MSDKNINRLFEVLTPQAERKENMLRRILAESRQADGARSSVRPKRFRFAALAAIMLISFATTAFAAAYMGLDDKFLKFLNPINREQANHLANGAYKVDRRIDNENGSLEIKQVLGDGNLTYLLIDFTAQEGTVLDAARYRFQYGSVQAGQLFQSTGFKMIDDGNPSDNHLSLIMSVMTEDSMAGTKGRIEFNDLQAADPLPGEFETVIPGHWEAELNLDFKDVSTLYRVDRVIDLFGYKAELESISVSPISITLKIASDSLKEINDASGRLKETGDNENEDDYPVTIRYKDGTSETTSIFTGLRLSDMISNRMLMIKTFDNAINDKEIASIVFFGEEIRIRD